MLKPIKRILMGKGLYQYVPPPRRLLCIRPDDMGDVVWMTPTLAAIKARFPQCHITVLCSTQMAPLLLQHPCVDDVVEDVWWQRTALFSRPFWQGVNFFKLKQWDAVLHFLYDPLFAWMAFCAGIPYRVGDRSKFLMRSLCNVNVTQVWGDPGAHAVELNLQLIRPLGIKMELEKLPRLHVPVDTQCEKWFSELLKHQTPESGGKVIVMAIGSGGGNKAWTPQGFAQAIRLLLQRGKYRVVLVGGQGERQAANKIMAALEDNRIGADSPTLRLSDSITDLVGNTTLMQLVSVIRSADVFVGVDSGPLHMAAALGRPTLALFPTKYIKPLRSGPWGTRHLILRESQVCPLACFPRSCPESICLDAITPDQVMTGVEKLLSGAGYVLPEAQSQWFTRSMSLLFIAPPLWSDRLISVLEMLIGMHVPCVVVSANTHTLPKLLTQLLVYQPTRYPQLFLRWLVLHNVTVVHDVREASARNPLSAFFLAGMARGAAFKLSVLPLVMHAADIPSDAHTLLKQYRAAFGRRSY